MSADKSRGASIRGSAGTRRERGASLVEAAFVLPVVLLVLFGVVEFGRYLSVSQGVSTAAREAARYGIAAGPSDNGIPRYTDCAEIIEAGQALSGLGSVDDVDFTITYTDDAGTVVADCDGTTPEPDPDPSNISDGYRIVVAVSRPFDELIPFTRIVLPSNVTANDQRTIYLVTP